jgi:hypothetical protein
MGQLTKAVVTKAPLAPMPLTRLQIVNAKPHSKPVKLFDGRGLYIAIAPSGGRWWRFKYRLAGKENESLGIYPEVGLKD